MSSLEGERDATSGHRAPADTPAGGYLDLADVRNRVRYPWVTRASSNFNVPGVHRSVV